MKTHRCASLCIFILLVFLAGCHQTQPAPQSKTLSPTLSPPQETTSTPQPLQGQASITGRIIAGYGGHQAMEQLPVKINGLPSSTVTDQDGVFTLKDLPIGTWTIQANALSYSVKISDPNEQVELGLIKYPLDKIPDYYSEPVPPVEDLNALVQAGESIPFGTAIYYANWQRPYFSVQQKNIWSREPYNELPEDFLSWWFEQPAVIYDTIDILDQNGTDEYASDPQFSEWRDLLGLWEIELASDWHYWEGDYQDEFFYPTPDSMNDLLEGEMIEVWLIGYKAFTAIKSGDHYFLDVYGGGGFSAIRLPGNGGKPYQIHLIEDGREVARLPRLCRKPGDPDCDQPYQTGLSFYPSPTPTAFPAPEPTPSPASLSNLQVINRTNVNEVVPVWRFEPPNNRKETWGARFAFHPNEKTVAVTVGKHVELIDLVTGQTIQNFTLETLFGSEHQPSSYKLEFSPAGNRLAGLTETGPVLWETSTGKALWKADWSNVPGNEMGLEDFTDMVFSPAGDILVTTAIAYGSQTHIWSAESGKVIKSLDVWNQLDAVFSHDGARLYTVDRLENYVRAWDTTTWEEVDYPNPQGYPITLTLSPNGEIFAVNSGWNGDGEECTDLYLVDDWKYLGRLGQPDLFGLIPNYGPTRIEPSFNSDGGIIAIAIASDSASRPDHLELYDTAALKLLISLEGSFQTPIDQVAFSPDGRLLAARSDNGTMIFWGVPAN